jgi:rod shape determining protein RodA
MLLSERSHDSMNHLKDVLRALGVAAIPMGLILLQPDMGTVLIISASVVAIIGISGAHLSG